MTELDTRTVAHLAVTCKQLNVVIKNDPTWKSLVTLVKQPSAPAPFFIEIDSKDQSRKLCTWFGPVIRMHTVNLLPYQELEKHYLFMTIPYKLLLDLLQKSIFQIQSV
jgi:hypothetical protein